MDRLPLREENTFIPDVKVVELTREEELTQLKLRLDAIEREMGKLTMEREVSGRRFQYLLSLNKETPTHLEIPNPIDTVLHVREPDPFQKELRERYEHFHAH